MGTAGNVSINFNAQDNIPLLWDDIQSKFPIHLESKQSVELLASVSMGKPRKHSILVKWNDETGVEKSKELILTL